jgi:hypothetical protein
MMSRSRTTSNLEWWCSQSCKTTMLRHLLLAKPIVIITRPHGGELVDDE